MSVCNDTVLEELSKKLIEVGLYSEFQPLLVRLQDESEHQLDRLLDLNRQTQEKLDIMTLRYNELLVQQQTSTRTINVSVKKRHPLRSKSLRSDKKFNKENIPLEQERRTSLTPLKHIELNLQLDREEKQYAIFKKIQTQHLTQTMYLKEAIENFQNRYEEQQKHHEQIIHSLMQQIEDRSMEISKYRTCLAQISSPMLLNRIGQFLHDLRSISSRREVSDPSDMDDVLQTIEQCNKVIVQLQEVLQETHVIIQNLQGKNQSLEDQIYEMNDVMVQLTKENHRLNTAYLETGSLRQQVSNLENELLKIKQDQVHSTQLFAKALDDLERVQEENEQLESMLSSQPDKGHFLSPRYQTLFEQCYQIPSSAHGSSAIPSSALPSSLRGTASIQTPVAPVSCKSTISRESYFNSKKLDQLDQITEILDTLMSDGFDSLILKNKLKKITFAPGQFKLQMLWERLRTIIKIFEQHIITSYSTVELVDSFTSELQIICSGREEQPRPSFRITSLHGLALKENERLEGLSIVFQQLLQMVHDLKMKSEMENCIIEHSRQKMFYSQRGSNHENPYDEEYNVKVIQEISNMASRLISLSAKRDQPILKALDDLIVRQKYDQHSITDDHQLKRLIRNTQTSTSKMLMTIFKKYKEDILTMSNFFYVLGRGWKEVTLNPKNRKQDALERMLQSIEEGLSQLDQGELSQLIIKEIKSLSKLK